MQTTQIHTFKKLHKGGSRSIENMPLSYCGINIFGQFDATTPVHAVTNFQNVQINDFPLESHLKVCSTWCYAAYAVENRLLLQGFLGQRHAITSASRQEVTTETNIKDLCACDKFCLVLLDNGKLYKILPRVNAIMEEIKLDVLMEPLAKKRTLGGDVIDKMNEISRITHIACGTNMAVAIDEDNRVFSIPSEIHRFSREFKAKQLVCGFEHAMLLNTNGDVYVWGTGLRGQLGQEEVETAELPVLLDALAGIKITHIAAGGWHSAAISVFGDVYVWGYNADGQLGLGKLNTRKPKTFFVPQIATLPVCLCAKETETDECSPVKVLSGARHLVLVMQCGRTLSAGCNKNGQLGQNENTQQYVDYFAPMSLNDETRENCNIYCGHWNTIICT